MATGLDVLLDVLHAAAALERAKADLVAAVASAHRHGATSAEIQQALDLIQASAARGMAP